MSLHVSKLLAAIGAVIVSAVGSPLPDTLRRVVCLIVVLVIVDTCAGVYAAIVTKTLASRSLVEMLANKGVVYMILMLVAFVPCVIFSNWACAYAMSLLVVVRELLSLIEIARKLMLGGKDFGPINALLERIGNILAVTAEQAVAVAKITTTEGGKDVSVTATLITPQSTTTEKVEVGKELEDEE